MGVNLRIPVFRHGQLYIILLRVTDIRELLVLLPQEGDATTTNIIYPEVLLDSSGDGIAAGRQQGSRAVGQ